MCQLARRPVEVAWRVLSAGHPMEDPSGAVLLALGPGGQDLERGLECQGLDPLVWTYLTYAVLLNAASFSILARELQVIRDRRFSRKSTGETLESSSRRKINEGLSVRQRTNSEKEADCRQLRVCQVTYVFKPLPAALLNLFDPVQ